MTMTGQTRGEATVDAEAQRSLHALLQSLSRELFQTETSAQLHGRREADRLGDTPPAVALRAVADHADRVLKNLPALVRRHDMPTSPGGRLTGALFSSMRDKLLDRLLHGERSYRGTLLGMRHGIDLMRMLKHVAHRMRDAELGSFCNAWLDTRIPLVTRVGDELAWFASHPELAIKPVRRLRRRPAKTGETAPN